MTPKASRGIFYVVRYPAGWELITTRFENGEGADHSEWWETKVVGMVAEKWAARLRLGQNILEDDLKLLVYAFPRGRVSRVGNRFNVLQGRDIEPSMAVTRRMIEDAFGIVGQCSWRFDDHEQCQECDKDTIRRILHIREDWRAV